MAEENIEAIPDVDLGPIMDQLKATPADQQQQTQQQAQQPTEEKEFDLGQFKNPKDLLKSYKEIQSAFTKVTQENKSSKEELQRLREEAELLKLYNQAGPPTVYQQNQQATGVEDIDVRVNRAVITQRIADVLEEESDKDKISFQERYTYAKMIANEYPQLAQSAKGVKKLFEMGDKLRSEQLKRNAGKALESIFGEPLAEEEINRLRTLVKGNKASQQSTTRNAYMPDTSTSTRTGAESDQNPSFDAMISSGVKQGDVDGVIKALLDKAMAE